MPRGAAAHSARIAVAFALGLFLVAGTLLPGTLQLAATLAPARAGGDATVAMAATGGDATQALAAAGSDAGASTTRQPGPLPPGVDESGVSDPARLATAHAAALGNASYTVTSARVERFANGTLRTRVETTGRHGPGEGFHYVTAVEATADRFYAGPAGTWTVWSNGSLTVGAFSNGTGTAYQLRGRTDPSLDRQETLLVLFGSLETTVENRSPSNGTTAYRLESTGVVHPEDVAGAYGVDSVRNVSFSADVTREGLVRRYRLAFDASRGGATTRVVDVVRFSAVGSTTVPRPAWLSEAVARENATRG